MNIFPERSRAIRERDLGVFSFVLPCYRPYICIICYILLCHSAQSEIKVMLCYVMLCYVMLCYVMLCYVMLCYVMLCYVIT